MPEVRPATTRHRRNAFALSVIALAGLAIGASAWPGAVRGQAGVGVSLTDRHSEIGSNGRVVGPDGQLRDDDPKSNEFNGAGSFSDSKNSAASYDDGDGRSGQATGAGSQTSTVTVDSTGLAADVDAGIGATATVNGVPSQAQGIGQSVFQVTFTVASVTDYALEGSRTLPAQGEIDIRFANNDIAGASFNQSGTLQPGTYTLDVVAEARAQATTFFGLNVQEPPSNGAYHVSFRVGENIAQASAVAIGSGPSGTVASRSATFEFTTVDPDPPAGEFECRVDGQPDFVACTSPTTLTNLSDGAHTFRVRYDPEGPNPPSAATERVWTVDATAPSVTFDSAPSGKVASSSAQIAFHSSEPAGATFRCQLDGGAAFDCSSPQSLFDLADGPHSFSVTATDQAGNTSVPATAAWTVAQDGSVTAACEGGGESAGFGPVRLVARAADACFVDDFVGTSPVKVSRGRVTLNGVTLNPAPGTRIIVAPGLDDGTVSTDGPLTVGFGSIALSLPALELPSLGLLATATTKSITFGENALSDVAGLKALPIIQLELKPDNGGQLTATFKLKLPKAAFRELPGRGPQVEGLTVEVAPTFSNDKGITFGGRIKLGTVYLFGQKIKDLDLAYDHPTRVFDGSFGLELGPKKFGVDPTLTFALTLAPTASECALRRLGLQASNLNKHIGDGVFLQRYGGNLECVLEGTNRFAKLTANVGVSAGPRVSLGPFGEVEAVSVDGTGTLAIPVGPQPPELFSFSVRGIGKIVDIPVTEQTVTYKAPASIFATGRIDFTAGVYGAQLTYGEGSFIAEDVFNIEAAGRANVLGFEFGADGVYSSTGFAVCFGEPGHKTGFGKRWIGGELTAFVACDVGPFRARASGGAAQAGRQSVTVGRGRPLTVLAAEGKGAPPKVVVTGPPRKRIETPAGPGGVSTKDVLLVQDPDRDTTFVVLFRPAAGRWRLSTTAGSPALRRLRVARGLPPLKITAKVSGRGARRVLSWRAKGLAGQRLQLVERSRRAANLLTTTKRSSGKLRFRPDPRLGARRTIEAIAFNGATPRSASTVARYRVSSPRVPKRIRGLKLEKRILSWRAQPGIATYELALRRADGTTILRSARRARLKLAGLSKGTLRVSIVAVNARGRSGPIKTARFTLN